MEGKEEISLHKVQIMSNGMEDKVVPVIFFDDSVMSNFLSVFLSIYNCPNELINKSFSQCFSEILKFMRKFDRMDSYSVIANQPIVIDNGSGMIKVS